MAETSLHNPERVGMLCDIVLGITMRLLNVTVWLLGITVWLLGVTMRLLGVTIWLLGVTMRLLGVTVWLLGVTVWLLGVTVWLLGATMWLLCVTTWLLCVTVSLLCVTVSLRGVTVWSPKLCNKQTDLAAKNVSIFISLHFIRSSNYTTQDVYQGSSCIVDMTNIVLAHQMHKIHTQYYFTLRYVLISVFTLAFYR